MSVTLVKGFKQPRVSIKVYNQATVSDAAQQQRRFGLFFGEMRPKSGSPVMWEAYCLTKEGRDFRPRNKGSSSTTVGMPL